MITVISRKHSQCICMKVCTNFNCTLKKILSHCVYSVMSMRFVHSVQLLILRRPSLVSQCFSVEPWKLGVVCRENSLKTMSKSAVVNKIGSLIQFILHFFISVLALQELTEKADCVLPIENQVWMNAIWRNGNGNGINHYNFLTWLWLGVECCMYVWFKDLYFLVYRIQFV